MIKEDIYMWLYVFPKLMWLIITKDTRVDELFENDPLLHDCVCTKCRGDKE